MATKTLLGKVNLTAGTYDFVLPTQINTAMPNALSNSALEEVYIVCDSTGGAININLPQIALFKGSWNTKIYVNDIAAIPTSVTVNAYGTELLQETINGAAFNIILGVLGTNYYHIVSDNNWMCLVATGVISEL